MVVAVVQDGELIWSEGDLDEGAQWLLGRALRLSGFHRPNWASIHFWVPARWEEACPHCYYTAGDDVKPIDFVAAAIESDNLAPIDRAAAFRWMCTNGDLAMDAEVRKRVIRIGAAHYESIAA